MTEKHERNEPMELVGSCGPTNAEMIEEILKNNGIECALQGETSANTLPATGDLDEVRIWVQPAHAAKARKLVKDFFTPIAGYKSEDSRSDS